MSIIFVHKLKFTQMILNKIINNGGRTILFITLQLQFYWKKLVIYLKISASMLAFTKTKIYLIIF